MSDASAGSASTEIPSSTIPSDAAAAPTYRSALRWLVPGSLAVAGYLGLCLLIAHLFPAGGAAVSAPAARPAVLARSPDTFPWAVIGELSLVVYAYSSFARRAKWREVCLGAALWAGELVWEMVNGLVAFWWGVPLFGIRGHTAWHLYAGVNIEISMMFAIAPLVLFGILPKEKRMLFGPVSTRTIAACALGAFCVFVEVLLNRSGALVWEWWFWRWPHIGVIAFAYCAPFVLLEWVHERTPKVRTCALLLALVAGAAVVSHVVIHVLFRVPLPA